LNKVVALKDPLTGLPFPNNQIPVSRFDPASLGVLKFLPTVGGTGIVFYSSPLHQNFHDVLGRADQIISAKDHLSARYNYQLFTNAPVYTATNILSYADGSDICCPECHDPGDSHLHPQLTTPRSGAINVRLRAPQARRAMVLALDLPASVLLHQQMILSAAT
jgi:hypothetical protein